MKLDFARRLLGKVYRRIDRQLFQGKLERTFGEEPLIRLRWENPYRFETLYRRSPDNPLAVLCDVHGSDKGEVRTEGHPYWWPSHTYADYVSRLFGHCRDSVQRVFECGIGTNNPELVSNMTASGKPGASLRVWRDYFPNANIYGADIDENILFQEERIVTSWVDQTDPDSIKRMWKKFGGSFDLMVDDGLHTFEAGKTLFENSFSYLADHGIYIIEDVNFSDLVEYEKYFSTTSHFVDLVVLHRADQQIQDNCLVVIRKGL